MPFRIYVDPWGQWKAPGVRKFALAAIGLYLYVSYLPSRESMRISHDPTRAASPVVASTDTISEEDVRPYWMRVWNYWGQGGEELHKEKMDWAWGEVDKSRQQSYFKLAVEPPTARKEIYLFVLFYLSLSLKRKRERCLSTVRLTRDRPLFVLCVWCVSEPIKKDYLSGPQQTAHLKDWVPKTVIDDELACVTHFFFLLFLSFFLF